MPWTLVKVRLRDALQQKVASITTDIWCRQAWFSCIIPKFRDPTTIESSMSQRKENPRVHNKVHKPRHAAASHLADLSHIKALKAMQPRGLIWARSRAVVLSWSLHIHVPW